MIKNVLIIIIN